jgi:hypothetical protein
VKKKIRVITLWILGFILLFSALMLIAKGAMASVRQVPEFTASEENIIIETENIYFTLFFPPKAGGVIVHFLSDGNKIILQENELPESFQEEVIKKDYGGKIFEMTPDGNSADPFIQDLLDKLELID